MLLSMIFFYWFYDQLKSVFIIMTASPCIYCAKVFVHFSTTHDAFRWQRSFSTFYWQRSFSIFWLELGTRMWSCVTRYFIHVFFVRVALTHGTLIRWFRVQFHNLWVCSISACRSEKTHRSNFVVSLWLMPAGGTYG